MRSISNREKNDFRTNATFRKVTFALPLAMLLFLSASLSAQVLTNQGAVISVSGGAVVDGDTIENVTGTIENAGTINLSGHYINAATTSGNGFYNIQGNWVNTGTFYPGSSSVQLLGTGLQNLINSGDGSFYDLVINNTGIFPPSRIFLFNNIEVTNTLSLTSGNIETGLNKVFLSNQSGSSLIYTSGRIIGKFERGINSEESYLFPIGSEDNNNAVNLDINSLSSEGSVLSEFFRVEPGDAGLPIQDDSTEIYGLFENGYWSLKANGGFSVNNFDLSLDGYGFAFIIEDTAHIVKRDAPNGDWGVDGEHEYADGFIAYRNNLTGGISPGGNHFGFGRGHPRILVHPEDFIVCEESEAIFGVGAVGPKPLKYQWQINQGSGWSNLSDNAVYSGSTSDSLKIFPSSLSMDGDRFRVLVTDRLSRTNISDSATLTVEPIPTATATADEVILCNNETTHIELTSNLPGTTFEIEVLYNGAIAGATEILSGDTITHTLTNTSDVADSVVYRIIPYGTGTLNCEGISDTVVIWVEPTPRIFPVPLSYTQCDSTTTDILLQSPSVFTSGLISFDYTAVASHVDVEFTATGSGLSNGDRIEDFIVNPTDAPQTVTYTITPVHPGSCNNGPQQTVVVTVNPTPNIFLRISDPSARITSDSTFCNGFDVLFEVSNYQVTTGTVKYDLVVDGDIVIIDGETPTSNNRTIGDFTNTLSHTDSQIRELNYRFIPYIENAYGTTGCYGGLDTTVNVKVVPVLSAIETPTVLDPGFFNITCHGLSDGEILLTPEGGDLRYTYEINWENVSGDIIQTQQADYDFIEGLSAGIYEYAVTDTIGCFFSGTIELTEPDTLAIDDHTIVSPQCYGDDPTGEVYVDLSGGVKTSAVYKEYEWEHALTEEMVGSAENLTGVISGPFNFTFKDYYNCTFDTLFIIPPANRLVSDTLTISEYGDYHISCNGASDGRVEVIGLGGTGSDSYTYKWYADPEDETPISDTSYIENMPAGTYYYWLRDANGCLLGGGLSGDSLIAIELTEPDPISFMRDANDLYPGGWDISCFGLSDGEINLQYLGGHTEYLDNTFAWSGDISSTDSILDGLSEGSYTVKVTDAFWCSGETTFVLQQPPQITYDTVMSGFAGLNNVSCFGRSDGFIHLENVSGGGTTETPGTFNFAWTPSAGVILDDETQQDQDNLPAGRYYFAITDQIGCSVLDSAEIIQPDSLFAIPSNSLRNGYEISCYNGSDGWVSLEPAGGTRPYSYDWSDETGSATDTVITGLNEGYYSVTITDPNGCENFYEWELQYPDTIVLNPNPILIECFGDTSTIRISPEGGVGGYTYLWEGGVTSRDLTGVTEGSYQVIVTDENGCEVSDSIYLEQRSRIMPEIVVRSDYNGRHISCYGAENAAVELVISGGNDSNYTFEWNTSTGDNNNYTLSGLPAGLYSVNGEDASGCPFDTVKEVVQPSDINVMYTAVDPRCEGNENGSISISVVGGTPMIGSPIYNYSLNGEEFLPAPEFENLAEGEYVIVVKDANNCTDTTEVVLVAPEALAIEFETTPAECKDKADGTLTINSVEGGTMPYYINGGTSQYFDNLLPGDFVIELIDGNDCFLIDTAYIEALRMSCLSLPNAFTPNGDGANDVWVLDDDENGVNDMYLYPDAELRIYNRWGELLYYSNNVADEPWDGTYRGRDLPVDSYHYVLDLGNEDPPITGSVTIIR